jgi:hypothetical protein
LQLTFEKGPRGFRLKKGARLLTVGGMSCALFRQPFNALAEFGATPTGTTCTDPDWLRVAAGLHAAPQGPFRNSTKLLAGFFYVAKFRHDAISSTL